MEIIEKLESKINSAKLEKLKSAAEVTMAVVGLAVAVSATVAMPG